MEFRIESSQFSPNHGGGGGTFYQGREQEHEQDEQEEQPQDKGAPCTRLDSDSCQLPQSRRSSLGLVTPVGYGSIEDHQPIAEVDAEIHRSVRVLNLMMIRLEREFERRLHVEIGDVVVGA